MRNPEITEEDYEEYKKLKELKEKMDKIYRCKYLTTDYRIQIHATKKLHEIIFLQMESYISDVELLEEIK